MGGANAAQIGLGVQLGSIDNLMGSGALQTTGNPLDVAIQGDGFFRVGQGTPPAVPTNVEYTRAGNFTRNTDGYLVTQDGYYVVGKTANDGTGTDTLLLVPPDASGVTIGQDGGVNYIDNGRHRARPRATSRWPSSRTPPASSAPPATAG